MANVQLVRNVRGLTVRSLPAIASLPRVHKRYITDMRRGGGGRSSFSGTVATVFGATGFYGRYVVNRLGRVGSQVVIPYRGDEHDYRHMSLMGDLGQLSFQAYNLKDTSSVAKVVKYSNLVINLIGRDYETRNFSFNNVHVDGARVIAEACKQAGVERLIHCSALGASLSSPSTFLQSKAKGEEVVRDAFPSATIIRPACTYGHEDNFFNYYASLRSFPLGRVPLINYGLGVFKQPVAVVDVASALMNMIRDPTTVGKTYEFVGPNRYELFDLVQYMYRVMYRPCRPWAPPKPLFQLAAWLLEKSPFPPQMTRDRLTRFHLSEELTGGLPGLEDVGVYPMNLEDVALTFLRRFRSSDNFRKSLDEIEPLTK